MDQQAELCETYQLKWNFYSSYMHSCIASSLYNDSYADVALVTIDGHQLMAHRYVLSYSSRYFAQILKYQRKVTTALPLMIVMPPEIDYKSLKVLLRYMYSGEAKVPKEILKGVLRGGDILQIKGLFREKEEIDKNVKISQSYQQPLASPASSVSTPATTPTPVATSSPPPLVLTSANHQKVVKKSTANSSTSNVTSTITSVSSTNSTHTKPKLSQKGPKYLILQKTDAASTNAQTQKVLNFTIVPQKKDEVIKKQNVQKSTNENENEIKVEPTNLRDSNIQYLMIKDEPVDWSEADMEVIDSQDVYDDIQCKSEHEDVSFESNQDDEKMFSPLTCELCTETFTIPKEWVRHVQTHTDMLPAKRRRRDSTGGNDSYENDTFPELMCDLCQKGFETPADWVKHIQSTHTEFELHLSNKQNDGENNKSVKYNKQQTNSSQTDLGKYCSDCNKSFPSNASMLIHKRSHTGEKPFSCEWCSKTFNVKSNLLRHLRTIHNKIMNATDLEGKDEENSR